MTHKKLISGCARSGSAKWLCKILTVGKYDRLHIFCLSVVPNFDVCDFQLSSETVKKIDCTTYLRSEELTPAVTMRQACLPLRPTNHRLCPLGARDIVFDDKQLWALTLNYTFNISKQTEVYAVSSR